MRAHSNVYLFAMLGVISFLSLDCSKHPLAPRAAHDDAPTGVASTMRHVKATQGHIEGVYGPGARYGIDVPENWNGDLVVFAHGYRSPGEPVDLGDPGPLRDRLLELGYAFAYSSYSENGYALKDGAQRTHQLRGIFVSHCGRPERTYLVGRSLGGIVCQKLIEEHPGQYDGALLVAGVLGGTRAELEYISNVRVLFDYFYPGVLPGSLLELPPGVDFMSLVPSIVGAVSANPQNLVAMANVDQCGIAFASFPELVDSVIQALGFQFVGLDDFLERTHGHSMFDNSRTIYTGPLDPALLADLNTRVARHTSTPDADHYLARYYEPHGGLRVPALTLHTSRDPVVPLFHEERYGGRVDPTGASFLVQRTVVRHGHNVFETAELVSAFEHLVLWAEDGVRPAS